MRKCRALLLALGFLAGLGVVQAEYVNFESSHVHPIALTPSGGRTNLTMTMDARAHKLLPKLLNPLFRRMIAKAVERDMDLVKSACEEPG